MGKRNQITIVFLKINHQRERKMMIKMEKMAMFVKRFNKSMKMNNSKKSQKCKVDQVICYVHKKLDHVKYDYPYEKSKKPRRKR